MKIKIGTDCSGIEAPIQALHKLKIDYSHEFSSDIDVYAKESILANYKPNIFYDDMTKKRDLPKIDIYICGFPCQPFSLAGEREGSKNKEKGNIFLHCIKAIKQTEPSLFILENVPGVISVEQGTYWKKIINILRLWNSSK
jgi:DNA (cytosine-5)-methyltransferase 1